MGLMKEAGKRGFEFKVPGWVYRLGLAGVVIALLACGWVGNAPIISGINYDGTQTVVATESIGLLQGTATAYTYDSTERDKLLAIFGQDYADAVFNAKWFDENWRIYKAGMALYLYRDTSNPTYTEGVFLLSEHTLRQLSEKQIPFKQVSKLGLYDAATLIEGEAILGWSVDVVGMMPVEVDGNPVANLVKVRANRGGKLDMVEPFPLMRVGGPCSTEEDAIWGFLGVPEGADVHIGVPRIMTGPFSESDEKDDLGRKIPHVWATGLTIGNDSGVALMDLESKMVCATLYAGDGLDSTAAAVLMLPDNKTMTEIVEKLMGATISQ